MAVNGNGWRSWAIGIMGTIVLGLAATIFGLVNSDLQNHKVWADTTLVSLKKHNEAQDSSIARLNQQTALDRQSNQTAFRAIDHNVQLILDELGVPQFRRAQIDTTATTKIGAPEDTMAVE